MLEIWQYLQMGVNWVQKHKSNRTETGVLEEKFGCECFAALCAAKHSHLPNIRVVLYH